jgi:hypothetical protein
MDLESSRAVGSAVADEKRKKAGGKYATEQWERYDVTNCSTSGAVGSAVADDGGSC